MMFLQFPGAEKPAMAHFMVHFTLDEANALLPWVRGIFTRVQALLQELARVVADPPEAMPRGFANGNGHGHGSPPPPLSDEERQERLDTVNALLRQVLERGIVIQDVERGLIDFPALRGAGEVLLCYELADGERIGFWHGLHDGYAGRRPIEEL